MFFDIIHPFMNFFSSFSACKRVRKRLARRLWVQFQAWDLFRVHVLPVSATKTCEWGELVILNGLLVCVESEWSFCLYVALRWTGDSPRVSPCLCPMMAGKGSSRRPRPWAQGEASAGHGWMHVSPAVTVWPPDFTFSHSSFIFLLTRNFANRFSL